MRVLFATDGSPCAKDAAGFLHGLSFKDGLELTLLTVTYDPESVSHKNIQPWFPEWRESQQKFVGELHAEMDTLFADSCRSLSSEHRHGNVSHQIIELANEMRADLVVMGAVGHSMIGRMFLGSVSDDVATRAKCSVVIVRPPTDGAVANHSSHNITFAFDGSHAANESIEELSCVRWNSESKIGVVTVMQEPDYLISGGVAGQVIQDDVKYLQHLRESCEAATSQLKQIIPNSQPQTVRAHHIGDTILRTAAENQSDLIVVGDAGHKLVDELIVGSTAKYVLRHAPCGVWISRHHRK